MAREIDTVIEKELSRFDVPNKCVKRVAGGRHMRLVVTGPSKDGYMPYSLDCSGRGLFNFRADLRRFLRALGFVHEVPQERVGSLGDALLEAASRSKHHKPEMTVMAKTELPAAELAAKIVDTPPPPLTQPKTTVETKGKATMKDITVPARSQLLQAEVAQVTMLITQNARVDFAKKICDYNPSWSDERVLRMIAHGDRKHLELNTITKFRKSVFGRTPEEISREHEARASGGMGAVWSRLSDLHERVSALEAAATDPHRGNGAPSNTTAKDYTVTDH